MRVRLVENEAHINIHTYAYKKNSIYFADAHLCVCLCVCLNLFSFVDSHNQSTCYGIVIFRYGCMPFLYHNNNNNKNVSNDISTTVSHTFQWFTRKKVKFFQLKSFNKFKLVLLVHYNVHFRLSSQFYFFVLKSNKIQKSVYKIYEEKTVKFGEKNFWNLAIEEMKKCITVSLSVFYSLICNFRQTNLISSEKKIFFVRSNAIFKNAFIHARA